MSGATVISIDAMGGDRGPSAVLGGLVRLRRKMPELGFIVHGDAPMLKRLMQKRAFASLSDCCEIRHAEDVVTMDDKPSRALRERRQSSMWAALEAVKRGEAQAAVSSGNTGALLAMSVLILRKAPGIDRPAIAAHWPSRAPHGFNTVLDVGADVRADARALVQFAVMGAEYARISFGIERPRIGFLSNGTESTKGTADLRIAAARAAEADPDLFESVGFVEGTDIPSDRLDVIVTDGFTGNIALKTAEGTASFISTGLREAFRYSVLSRLGTLFALTSLKRFSKRIDPRRANGGVFLGLNGAVVKSHGGSDAIGFASAVRLAAKLGGSDLAGSVGRQLGRIDMPEPDRQDEPGGNAARLVRGSEGEAPPDPAQAAAATDTPPTRDPSDGRQVS